MAGQTPHDTTALAGGTRPGANGAVDPAPTHRPPVAGHHDPEPDGDPEQEAEPDNEQPQRESEQSGEPRPGPWTWRMSAMIPLRRISWLLVGVLLTGLLAPGGAAAIGFGEVAGAITYADSGNGVPGVTVEVAGLSTVTGKGGAYRISGVPAGDHPVAAHLFGFPNPPAVRLAVHEGQTADPGLVLPTRLPTVGVLDSPFNGAINGYLSANGITNEAITWDADFTRYGVIVVNQPGDPGASAMKRLLASTDEAGVGVVFLDSATASGSGISLLNAYLGNPAVRRTGAVSGYRVTAKHPVLEGFATGTTIALGGGAWFDGYTGEDRTVIAAADGSTGSGIGVQQRPTNRHVLLSLNGASTSDGPGNWTRDGAQVFVNALRWASRPGVAGGPVFVPWDLRVSTDRVPSGSPVAVSANVTNIGAGTGSHTATLLVDGVADQSTTVRLASGDTTTVQWSVARTKLATYQLAVGNLTASFRVRAPVITLSTSTVDDSGPLSGATVELIDPAGKLIEVGATDSEGKLSFETTALTATYTVVVRRTGSTAYLLTRALDVNRDQALTLTPRTSSSASITLTSDDVDQGHRSWTYLRSAATGKWGFAFPPGTVIATTGTYQLRQLHTGTGPDRDWWAVTDQSTADFATATSYSRQYGGPTLVQLSTTITTAGAVSGTWSVTDAHGSPFTMMSQSDRRSLAAREAVPLDDLPAIMATDAPAKSEVSVRVADLLGSTLYQNPLGWETRTFAVPQQLRRGQYTVYVTAATGAAPPLVAARKVTSVKTG